MFPQSTTLIAAAVAILFAPISLSAAVYGAPSDHAQLVNDSRGFAPPSEAFIHGNNTQLLDNTQHVKTRQAAEIAELATTVIEGAINIFTSIQDGIKQDKEDRSTFTQHLVQQLHSEHPDFNWIVCHTKHDYKWDGKQGVDWAHKHQEFDIKIGGTIGYEIYNAKSGKFFRKGDGGYLNWAYIGNVAKTENDGKDLTFAKP
ncbi:hypothetical protein PC9H_005704 [Pleurotus ostreatus]|uniref:DUF7888 domain-containing protein n=2 Tax=Pleurotus ostreatus TaxID=5322 RepID=A0A8H6ZZI2_PLEOS|nr:uncharacterized protein PC9H_005704 [Pleurotus ostreatus]KAF7433739.1 hypothetical protein PC9H_005704 [Pleurotus ostreatus]KAJ8697481.1 hypothetical protein PTI98_004284 [Pleurotus ostreatus]